MLLSAVGANAAPTALLALRLPSVMHAQPVPVRALYDFATLFRTFDDTILCDTLGGYTAGERDGAGWSLQTGCTGRRDGYAAGRPTHTCYRGLTIFVRRGAEGGGGGGGKGGKGGSESELISATCTLAAAALRSFSSRIFFRCFAPAA